jgi:hypothetical protein
VLPVIPFFLSLSSILIWNNFVLLFSLFMLCLYIWFGFAHAQRLRSLGETAGLGHPVLASRLYLSVSQRVHLEYQNQGRHLLRQPKKNAEEDVILWLLKRWHPLLPPFFCCLTNPAQAKRGNLAYRSHLPDEE